MDSDAVTPASVGNLFADLPADLPDELFQTLAGSGDVRVERIVSRGHRSPEGFWYDQPSGSSCCAGRRGCGSRTSRGRAS